MFGISNLDGNFSVSFGLLIDMLAIFWLVSLSGG